MLENIDSPLRQAVARQVRQLTGDSRAALDFTQPAGDPGWFGPDSMSWRVHADFVAMMTGGVAALMLQALHPLALAAVWDYSDFRADLRGRLHRTALFIAITTYGPSTAAQAAVDRVRAIHARVRGIAPDGQPYAADDPHLLTFIHIAEVYCFAMAYDALVSPLSGAQRDLYVAEMSRVPLALGAQNVPHDWTGLLASLETYRSELRGGPRPQAILRLLRGMASHPQSRPATLSAVERLLTVLGGRMNEVAVKIMVQAAAALLPHPARDLYGLHAAPALQASAIQSVLRTCVPVMRWALHDGVAAQARRRVGVA